MLSNSIWPFGTLQDWGLFPRVKEEDQQHASQDELEIPSYESVSPITIVVE